MTTEQGAWGADLEAWAAAMRAAALTSETIKLRVYDVGRLRRHVHDADPWSLELDDLLGFMGSHTWARETARGMRSSLRRFYAWGVGTGRAAENPALGLPKIAPERPVPRPADSTGVVVALRESDADLLLKIRLANELGMRRAEVAQVAREDAWRDLGGWSLRVHGKGRRERDVPLPDDLARAILTRRAGYLFPGKINGHLSARWVGKQVSTALPGDDTMHQLRHLAAAQWFRDTGGNLRIVQELLGHASVATTERYTPVDDDEKRAVVARRSARWAG